MKEEVGMKRRGPTWALVALAATGIVALSATSSVAAENLWENQYGLTGGTIASAGAAQVMLDPLDAGPYVNPLGVGQVLYGTYYDVREFGGDAQFANIQILNTNTNNTNLGPCQPADYVSGNDGSSCYNPDGGILAKIRFRDAKNSVELLDFNIALSCGEVWAGQILLNEVSGLPQIRSEYPIVTSVTASTVNTQNIIQGGKDFTQPGGVAVADMLRGYFEIFAMEALPCEPQDGEVDLAGNTWDRGIPNVADDTPSNSLAGEVFLVRVGAGVSHNYNMTAISRFVRQLGGSITPQNITGSEDPNIEDCRALKFDQATLLTPPECVSQVNLALSKNRLIGQFDADTTTAGTTHLVVNLPTKRITCQQGAGAVPPYECLTNPNDNDPPTSGEEITCTVYDRLEHFVTEDDPIFSPAPPSTRCYLPYELSIIEVVDGPTNVHSSRADYALSSQTLPAGESGWVDLDLARTPTGGLVHREVFPAPWTDHNIQGIFVGGYIGLPAIGLVLQEFQNNNPAVAGTYGNTVPMIAETSYILPGNQS